MKKRLFRSALFLLNLLCSSSIAFAEQASGAAAPPSSAAGDAAAELALSSLGGAKFVVARAGAQADALTRRAAALGLGVRIVAVGDAAPLDDSALAGIADAASALGAPKGVLAALDLGPAAFFAVWLRSDPEAAKAVRFAAFPSLVDSLVPGFCSVPDGLLFAPVPESDATADFLRRASQRFSDVRDEFGEILLGVRGGASSDAALAPWLQLAGCAGNNLGCLLSDAQMPEEAVAAFRAADAVNPSGVSPLLNLATLAKRGVGAAAREDLARRLGAIRAGDVAGSSLAAGGGYVLAPEDFFPAGWFWTASGLRKPTPERAEELFAAAEKVGGEDAKRAVAQILTVERALRSAFAAQSVDAFAAMKVADEGGWTARTAAVAARLLFDSNSRKSAIRLIDRTSERLVAEKGADAEGVLALSLLRVDMLGRLGDSEALSGCRGVFRAMPGGETFRAANLALAAASVEAEDWAGAAKDWSAVATSAGAASAVPWVAAAARGASALVSGNAAAAKSEFAAALAEGATNSWSVLAAALVADFATGDKAAAVPKARMIVELRPRHGFANFVLANIAAEQGRSDEAMFRYQASLAERFNWMAANDFASLMSKTGRPDMAERIARDALAGGGNGYAAVHDTLGEALAAQKRWVEALAAFRKASSMPGGRQPEILLHLAEALAATGENKAAAALIPEIDAGKSSFSIRDRERLGALRRAVAE